MHHPDDTFSDTYQTHSDVLSISVIDMLKLKRGTSAVIFTLGTLLMEANNWLIT